MIEVLYFGLWELYFDRKLIDCLLNRSVALLAFGSCKLLELQFAIFNWLVAENRGISFYFLTFFVGKVGDWL